MVKISDLMVSPPSRFGWTCCWANRLGLPSATSLQSFSVTDYDPFRLEVRDVVAAVIESCRGGPPVIARLRVSPVVIRRIVVARDGRGRSRHRSRSRSRRGLVIFRRVGT